MTATTLRGRLMASSLIAGAALALAAGAASAQTQPGNVGATTVAQPTAVPPQNADGSAAVEEVVVTGSRIARPNLQSASPLTVVGGPELQIQGHPSVEQTLRELPSTLGDGDNSTVNNGTAGIATIDLRGLGDNRTLVLVDGKRLLPTTDANQVNLNQIPSELLERVEVLTGGASSVYGGDAVSGVVNLILKKDFTGAEVSANERITGQGDGLTQNYNLLVGVNAPDHKGNMTLYGSYYERNPVLQADRPYSSVTLASPFITACDPNGPKNIYGGFCTAGSGSGIQGRDTLTGTIFTPDRTLVPYANQTFNFAPYNYYQTASNQYDFGAIGHYEFNEHADLYTRLTFSDSDTKSQLAPTPVVFPFQVNFGNPLLSAQERGVLFSAANFKNQNSTCSIASAAGCGPNDTADILYRRRLVENGTRNEDDDYAAYQAVVGLRGTIGEWDDSTWKYDVSAQYGRTRHQERLTGDASAQRFQDGLLVDPNGACSSGNTGCVPIDIFQANNISPAAVAYFTEPLDSLSNTEQADVQGSATGDIPLQSPLAKSKIGVAVGAEWRREFASTSPDDNLATGNILGFTPSQPTSGRYSVSEVFGEIRIPLIEGLPFIQQLEVDGGYRFSDYSTSGGVQSYKAAIEWQPVPDIRFRTSYNRAVREPNVAELFSPAQQSADTGTDPCGSHNGQAATASKALCIATGVPANNYSTSTLDCQGQCSSFHIGNPALSPEIGITKSAGVVLTPTFWSYLRGFTGTIDFYDIKIKQAIFIRPLQQVFDFCYQTQYNPTQDPTNPFCQQIHRDDKGTVTTTVSGVDLQEANIGYLSQRGVDVALDYRRRLSDWGLSSRFGTVDLNYAMTFVDKAGYQSSATAGFTNCLERYGELCGEPQPKWRSNLRLTWTDESGALSISGRWRHIGPSSDDTHGAVQDPLDASIGDYDYADFAVNYRFNDTLTFTAGVDNAFDKDPPLLDGQNVAAASYNSGNTFPGTYDVLGQVVYVSVAKKF